MLLKPYCYWDMGQSALIRDKNYAERVEVGFRLKTPVREQRGTIIPNWFKNPTTYPTTFSPTHRKVLFFNSSRGCNG